MFSFNISYRSISLGSLLASFLAIRANAAPLKQRQTTGCGIDAGAELGQTTRMTLTDSSREFLLHLPSNYDSNTPTGIVFSYHGRGKTMWDQEDLSQFSNEDWNPDMIAVYPQGINNAWQGAPYAPEASHPDLAFTTDLLNQLRLQYCVDDSRIFANGQSNGGGFVNTLACSQAHGGDFAAFAPVSGAFYDDLENSNCHPARSPMPILEFHGGNTDHIPYAGGPSQPGSSNIVPSIPDWLERWAVRNGCPDPPTPTTVDQNGGDVHKTTYSCQGVDQVVIGYLIDSMRHQWPSVDAGTASIDATPLIVDFFNSHPKV